VEPVNLVCRRKHLRVQNRVGAPLNASILQIFVHLPCGDLAERAYSSSFVSVRQPTGHPNWPSNCSGQLQSAPMPSFVYIARITGLSEEQAQGLRSAGFHVKSFGPGEITADECLLVMTSEALLASLHPANSELAAGRAATTGAEFEGIPPIPEMNAYLGSQAAVWNIIKITAANESASGGSRASRGNPAAFKLSAPSQQRSRMGPSPTSATLPGKVSGWRSRLWRIMATIVTLLIVAVTLLAHRVSILPSTGDTAADATNQSTATDCDSTYSAQAASGTPSQPTNRPHSTSLTLSSTEASTVSAGGRRHPPGYDFVAEDFTNHFDVHMPSGATLQNPELKHNAQASTERKRVVVN